MNLLIFNGSPRKAGDTGALLQKFKKEAGGRIRQIDAFSARIQPCIDCRRCRVEPGCAIQDGMTEIDRAIAESDGILIASPIWFGSLPGPLLTLASRLQQRYSSVYFRNTPPPAGKKGGIILVGGGSGGAEAAQYTTEILLRQMGADHLFPSVLSLQTDRIPAAADAAALEQIAAMVQFFHS